jgi:2-C-methyl-D-erythritol 4-phosphate cytidylyltransferase
MAKTSNNIAIILAGGVGSRMEANLPKQFIDLCNKPIIVWTIEKILSTNLFDYIGIAIHPAYKDKLLEIMKQNNISTDNIILADGGEERIDSIINILNKIEEYIISEDDILVIHDAVRPFVSKELLKNSVDTAKKYGCCVATVPAIDTMYILDKEGFISGFPSRKSIFNGQAPDTFKFGILKKSINNLSLEQRQTITGTVQICSNSGYPVKTIPGDYKNIKITNKSDLILAECILKNGEM